MPTLTNDLRNKLERVVVEARDVAEIGARAALESLAVHHHEPYPHMKSVDRELRNHLRARARQLGDRQDASGRLAIDHLVSECAYEHWHQMLFARFLAENDLLIEPEDNMAISLAEAEELAEEECIDVWVFASRCAQQMLPQIFRPDDTLLQIAIATEHMLKLEKLLASLPAAVFTASDALGWVYQFWQSKKKDEVNRSEVKIGADEISAVTQLFTEPYMVEFLLHNTLGVWWARKKLTTEDTENTETEEELRKKVALPGVTWDYLRFVRDESQPKKSSSKSPSVSSVVKSAWRPVAGTFDGWPKTAAELRVLDPCCGSGHFLVAGLHHLVPIRMAEEGLSAADAVDAVLLDNLHGLEIDERCCQIAAFALAFAAWTYPDAGGYRPLPELNIACTGIGPQCSADQWIKLAEQSGIPMPAVGREAIKNGLLNLHRLFSQAPTLGSLINPAELPADLIAADYETIQPYLTAIRAVEKADDETRERAIAAAGMVKAADLLAGDYTLVITNVPYLKRGSQPASIVEYADGRCSDAKHDLASIMMSRWTDAVANGSTFACVSVQSILAKKGHTKFRHRLLRTHSWPFLARLGPGAFESISGEVVSVALYLLNATTSHPDDNIWLLDAAEVKDITGIKSCLTGATDGSFRLQAVSLSAILSDPCYRIRHGASEIGEALSDFASALHGQGVGDGVTYYRKFWEIFPLGSEWELYQVAPSKTAFYAGREDIVLWEHESGRMAAFAQSVRHLNHKAQQWRSGKPNWGKDGVVISLVGDRRATIYTGQIYGENCCVVIPANPAHLGAIWRFVVSGAFADELKKIDSGFAVSVKTMLAVPFDPEEWVGEDGQAPKADEPESNDPTQWLFHGQPDKAQEGTELQVAVARLLGYRWPAELDDKMRLSKRARALVAKCGEMAKFADNDGIVCIPAVRGEDPAADRLMKLLAACNIEPSVDLDDWLRNGFFEQHCKLFHDRPFIWHIWDGRKRDGFHALVNYHKLSEGNGKGRKLLESLTYSYLGDWIARQRDGVKRGEGGAEDRLAAAMELQKRLEAILAGEPPFDLFVRWKPLSQQPISWNPDINDGVRLNIRPFLASDLPNGRAGAGILRFKPSIKWGKDRGKEPHRPKEEYPWFWGWDEQTVDFLGAKTFDGNRWNDCHYSNDLKQNIRRVSKP